MKFEIYPISLYIKKWPVIVFGLSALVINAFSWFLIISQVPRAGGQMVLHYTILFGVDKLGAYGNFFYLLLIGLAVIVLNLTLGLLVYKHNRFLSELLVTVAFLAQIPILFFSYLMVLLNA